MGGMNYRRRKYSIKESKAMLETTRKTVIGAGHPVIEYADVCIVTETTWHVFNRNGHANFLTSIERPDMPCPIVDISNLDPDLDERVAEIMGQYNRTHELAALLESLSNLGATITQRPCPLCIATPMHCITCTFGGLQ